MISASPSDLGCRNDIRGKEKIYTFWVLKQVSGETVINATDLQALTAAAHLRRNGSSIPEPTGAAISLLGLIGWAIRHRRKAPAATV